MSARTRRFLLAWTTALAALFAPWVAHRAAGLAFNLYDLYDLALHLPPVESGALKLNVQTLRLPFLALALTLPLALRREGWGGRLGALAVAFLLAVEVMPPYPQLLTAWKTPGWQVPFFWSLGTMVASLLLTAAGRRIPPTWAAWMGGAAVGGGFASALRTWWRLRPALAALYDAPIRGGWGLWLAAGAALLLVLLWWDEAREAARGRKRRRTMREALGMERARRVRARYAPRLMRRRGVVSVGVGEGEDGGAVIVIGVREAADAEGLPRELEGVPVRVEVIGTVRAAR